MANNRRFAEDNRFECPWTLLRPFFLSLSFFLFLVSLHSFIYVTYVSTKTPDCFECDPQKEDKNCYNYCNIIIDDFVYAYDPRDRNYLLIFFAMVLLLRCMAYLFGFMGVSTFMGGAVVFYLIMHLGLILSLLSTLLYFSFKGHPVFEYVFGRTKTTLVVLSLVYASDLILFSTGVSLSYKFFRFRPFETKESNEFRAQIAKRRQQKKK